MAMANTQYIIRYTIRYTIRYYNADSLSFFLSFFSCFQAGEMGNWGFSTGFAGSLLRCQKKEEEGIEEVEERKGDSIRDSVVRGWIG